MNIPFHHAIEGARLRELFDRRENISLLSKHIFPEPEAALEAIRIKFSEVPNKSGASNLEIIYIRDHMFSYFDYTLIQNLVITAPHTHWGFNSPTIISYDTDKDAYLIGPQNINLSQIYRPVTFIFTEIGLIPL
jgi:hypothetical protein